MSQFRRSFALDILNLVIYKKCVYTTHWSLALSIFEITYKSSLCALIYMINASKYRLVINHARARDVVWVSANIFYAVAVNRYIIIIKFRRCIVLLSRPNIIRLAAVHIFWRLFHLVICYFYIGRRSRF